MRVAILYLLCLLSLLTHAGLKPIYQQQGDLHLLCIGIDDYQSSFNISMKSCKSDAKRMQDKATRDFYQLIPSMNESKGSVKSYLLQGDRATYQNIKEVFKQIALNAKEEDKFVFFFAGISATLAGQEHLFTYSTNDSLDSLTSISMLQLAEWMENIAAKEQLVVSEAGPGSQFAMSLISNLFENNPYIAAQTDRNRVILTTRGMGYEAESCKDWHGGYLLKYMHNGQNLFKVFSNRAAYEYALIKEEMKCEVANYGQVYSALYSESTFRWLLSQQLQKPLSRSVVAEEMEEETTDSTLVKRDPKNYALVISTGDYRNGSPSWVDLYNPKRDADAFAELIHSRYGFDTIRVHDKSKNEVLQAIIALKEGLQEEDKVIVFIAGHGYYDDNYNSSYLVFTDGPPVKESEANGHGYYLNMSTLNNMLTKAASEQMFLILDVCFGAHFDITAPDIHLSDYSQLQLDMPLEEWIYRNDTAHRSRIFLASGTGEVPDYWNTSYNHSPFADKLLNAFRNEVDFISPGKIFKYMQGNITEPVLKDFSNRLHDPRSDFLMPVLQEDQR